MQDFSFNIWFLARKKENMNLRRNEEKVWSAPFNLKNLGKEIGENNV